MKRVLLIFACILILTPSVVEAQRRNLNINVRSGELSEGELKAEIFRYETMQQNGILMTKIGLYGAAVSAVATIPGFILLNKEGSGDASLYFLIGGGSGVAAFGITALVGQILKGRGISRAQQYRIMLEDRGASIYMKPNYVISPNYAGVSLTFRF